MLPDQERDQRREQNKIEREMPGEAEIFARVSKATATDVEPARFGHDSGDDEYEHQSREDKNASAKKNARDKGEAGKNFQPRQVKRQPDARLPGQHLVIVDIPRESDSIEEFHDAGVDKKAADDYRDNEPKKSTKR